VQVFLRVANVPSSYPSRLHRIARGITNAMGSLPTSRKNVVAVIALIGMQCLASLASTAEPTPDRSFPEYLEKHRGLSYEQLEATLPDPGYLDGISFDIGDAESHQPVSEPLNDRQWQSRLYSPGRHWAKSQ
jgi:hypothetical protein